MGLDRLTLCRHHVVSCVARPASHGGIVDERIFSGLQWLVEAITAEFANLDARRKREMAEFAAAEEQRRKARAAAREAREAASRTAAAAAPAADASAADPSTSTTAVPVVVPSTEPTLATVGASPPTSGAGAVPAKPSAPLCTQCKIEPAVRRCAAAGWQAVCDDCGARLEAAKAALHVLETGAAAINAAAAAVSAEATPADAPAAATAATAAVDAAGAVQPASPVSARRTAASNTSPSVDASSPRGRSGPGSPAGSPVTIVRVIESPPPRRADSRRGDAGFLPEHDTTAQGAPPQDAELPPAATTNADATAAPTTVNVSVIALEASAEGAEALGIPTAAADEAATPHASGSLPDGIPLASADSAVATAMASVQLGDNESAIPAATSAPPPAPASPTAAPSSAPAVARPAAAGSSSAIMCTQCKAAPAVRRCAAVGWQAVCEPCGTALDTERAASRPPPSFWRVVPTDPAPSEDGSGAGASGGEGQAAQATEAAAASAPEPVAPAPPSPQ